MTIRTMRYTIEPKSIAWLEELNARLSQFSERAELPLELVDLIDRCPGATGTVDVQPDPALRAGVENRVALHFPQPWLELMAALRALDGRGENVGRTDHSSSPSCGLATAMVNESPSAREAGGDSDSEATP